MDEQQLLDKHEFGTYLDGLYDALTMSKAEIRQAIKIITESD